MEKLKFLGMSELRNRWNYTRQAVNVRIQEDKDFPVPYTVINCGRTKIWLLSDIQIYENLRKDLLRRKTDSDFKVYCRSKEDYAKLSDSEKKRIAGENPYSKFNE